MVNAKKHYTITIQFSNKSSCVKKTAAQSLKMKGETIPSVGLQKNKFLGLVIDEHSTFEDHIKYISEKV